MSEYKIGDRVRVEFEAVVEALEDDDGDVRIIAPGFCDYGAYLKPSSLTLMEPEYEVGSAYIAADGEIYFRHARAGQMAWRHARNGSVHRDGWPERPLRKLVPEGK